jgi:hypothetical protein
MRWKRFFRLLFPEPPAYDPAEQIRLSWARRIASPDALPDIYKPFVASLPKDGQAFPYMLITPTFEGFLRRTTEKLIYTVDDEVRILERIGNAVKAYYFPLDGIQCIEIRIVLLDSRIKFSGVARNGVPASVSIKFNTATDHLFTPILEKIRLAFKEFGGTIGLQGSEEFDDLENINYKFMNYARRSLLDGEKALQLILQPEIRKRTFVLLGKKFFWRVSPTHMVILTDRELILVREEDSRMRIDEYSGVWDYIPLKKIENLSLRRKDDKYSILSIQLAQGERKECIFQASAGEQLNLLLAQYARIKTS